MKKVVPGKEEDLDQSFRIALQAKAQLASLGVDQWQKSYPEPEVWREDVRMGRLYTVVDEERPDQVLGAAAFTIGADPSYASIQGAWLTGGDTAYGVLHRVCVSDPAKGQGIAGILFDGALAMVRAAGARSLRIDTHEGNLPMRRALEKSGFTPCGIIILKEGAEAGDPRIAYEKLAGR